MLYTAGDLAATMALNVDLKVLSANGYFDSVTPFSQTVTDLTNMPLTDAAVRQNLTTTFFPPATCRDGSRNLRRHARRRAGRRTFARPGPGDRPGTVT